MEIHNPQHTFKMFIMKKKSFRFMRVTFHKTPRFFYKIKIRRLCNHIPRLNHWPFYKLKKLQLKYNVNCSLQFKAKLSQMLGYFTSFRQAYIEISCLYIEQFTFSQRKSKAKYQDFSSMVFIFFKLLDGAFHVFKKIHHLFWYCCYKLYFKNNSLIFLQNIICQNALLTTLRSGGENVGIPYQKIHRSIWHIPAKNN